MRPNKPGKTARSRPGPYHELDPPADRPSTAIHSSDAYDVPANIHDWLPFPLVHLAPPPAGFDHNPLSNRFVRDVTRQPPHFDSHPVRLTLPREAGIENDVLFAMKGSSRWIFQGKVYNGKAKKTSDAHLYDSDLSHHHRGPTRRHEWTKTWLCNCAGKPSTRIKPTSTGRKRLSSGSVRCQCRAKFLIRKTLTGDLEFEWYWRHNNHNPYSIDDMRNMRLPDVVSEWLNERVISGLTWRSIQRLLTCPDLFPDENESLGIVPEALNIDRTRVQNRIRRLAAQTKYLDSSVLTSISMWGKRLEERGWRVLHNAEPSLQRVSMAFLSPWQRTQLTRHGEDVLCFDSTHNVCSAIPEWPLSKFTLLTLVLRHPVSGGGIPVAWFLTTDERACVISILIALVLIITRSFIFIVKQSAGSSNG
ncbi:hypothetical protein DFH28DRAFT_919392 [Melampsora americana]|nr:hypothetical protein DFH28DRAFT_919392 [Melampsora americana]